MIKFSPAEVNEGVPPWEFFFTAGGVRYYARPPASHEIDLLNGLAAGRIDNPCHLLASFVIGDPLPVGAMYVEEVITLLALYHVYYAEWSQRIYSRAVETFARRFLPGDARRWLRV